SSAPTPVREQPAPKAVPGKSREPLRRRWGWLLFFLVLVCAAITGFVLKSRVRKPQPTIEVRTARVTRGPLEIRLRCSGTTSARSYANISAPMMRGPDSGRALVLIELAKPGSFVKKGDVVAQIDAQAIKDHVDDIDALVQQAEADVKQRRAEQAIEMEDLRQSLRQAKADLEKAKLDNSAAEIRTAIDREQLQLSVEEMEAQYKGIQKDIRTTEERQKAEIRILELTRDRHARHRDRHKGDVTKFTIRAPIPGLVVMTSVWRGGDMGQVQEGDQVYPGQPFMKIVDPSSMVLEATMNQVESEAVRIGQTAEINFDAFPSLRMEGEIESVGALATGGWRENYYIRNIPIKIALKGHDSRVIPDLSASADILIARTKDALLVPRAAVRQEDGKPVVFVKQGEGFEARTVELGAANNVQVAVVS